MEISFDLSDGLARIAFDDRKKDAVTLDALDALEAAMDEAVVIIGRPGSFCAGFDMTGMLGGDPDTPVKLGLDGGRGRLPRRGRRSGRGGEAGARAAGGAARAAREGLRDDEARASFRGR